MAKRTLTEGGGAAQRMKPQPRWSRGEEYSSPTNFSELELDAARQLVQLSGNSDDSTAASSSSSSTAASSGAATRRVYYDRAEASSAHREFCHSTEDFNDSDENRGRTRRKFGSVQRIYELTEPPSSPSLGRTRR